MYRMGKNSIERGNRDSWTVSPRALASSGGSRVRGDYERQFRDPARRDARAYVLPSDQPDFLTATRFIDALLKNGITIHRATAEFSAGGKRYPSGSFVVKTAQAFRPHVLDMFEPQDHPDDIPRPGAAPIPPYDSAGWTLAFQMGVKFDRILEGLEGPLERVDSVSMPAGRVIGNPTAAGYLISHHQNDAFTAAGRLLAAGESVFWPRDRSLGGDEEGAGVMYIRARPQTRAVLEKTAADLGVSFSGIASPPAGAALKLRPVRIALWDRYGGSSSSGWTRWLLERYGFSFDVIYSQDIDSGTLKSRYDVVVLTDDAVLNERDSSERASNIPAEYRHTTGSLSTARSVPQLKAFVEQGGTLITVGHSTAIAAELGLPLSSALVEARSEGGRPLTPEQYYIPGSVLRASVDNTTPLGYGFERQVDLFFDNSPVFRLESQAGDVITRVAWFASASPLRSGWAWGQKYLENGVAVADARLGRGRVLIFGPEINFRAQSHGTFKFLFNAIYYSTAEATSLDTSADTH